MGDMGSGLQSWIYRMQPRKPFSMKRKGSFTEIPSYQREFKIQASKERFKTDVILSGLLIFFSVGIFALYAPKFNKHSEKVHQEVMQMQKEGNGAALKFLLSSGKERLLNNNIIGAYSEFKLAYNIEPNNEDLKALLIETLSILCVENNSYCDKLDKIQGLL